MSREVKIGNIKIGNGNKIAIQSMATTRLNDEVKSIKQVLELEKAGCDIIRFSVLDESDAISIKNIKREIHIPLVADIHFDYKLALKSIENGADKIRINPGNIGSDEKVEMVAKALKETNIPVRVGSNTGSIEKEYLEKYGRNEIALAESALKHVRTLEKYGVDNIVISVKSSDVPMMIKAYNYISKKTDYPLHLGVTEAGTEYSGIIKNSIGIGSLLLNGIGDTIRVSLSAEPIREVKAGKEILRALNLYTEGVKIVACPTCGRCEWDCMKFASLVEKRVENEKKQIKVAIMGCAVNGPGEASDCDLGIAGAKEDCVIFVKGRIIKKLPQEEAKKEFFKELDKCLQ